jgi:hypothetical protein
VVLRIHDREDAPYLPAERDGAVSQRWEPSEAWDRIAENQDAGNSALVLSRTKAGCGQAVAELLEAGIPHVAERGRRVLRADAVALRIGEALDAWGFHSDTTTAANARALVDALRAAGPLLTGRRGLKKKLQVALRDRDTNVGPKWLKEAGLDIDTLTRQWFAPQHGWWEAALLESAVQAPDLMAIREWLAEYGSARALLEVAQKVVVTTAHGSKGREADLVVLDARKAMYLGTRKDDPGIQTTAERIDEDLRCLYVAITRTKEELVIIRGEDGETDWLTTHGIGITPNTRMGPDRMVASTPLLAIPADEGRKEREVKPPMWVF